MSMSFYCSKGCSLSPGFCHSLPTNFIIEFPFVKATVSTTTYIRYGAKEIGCTVQEDKWLESWKRNVLVQECTINQALLRYSCSAFNCHMSHSRVGTWAIRSSSVVVMWREEALRARRFFAAVHFFLHLINCKYLRHGHQLDGTGI